MTALYTYAEAFASIMAELEETGGELTPEIEARLDTAGLSLTEKAESVAAYLRELEADAHAFKHESDFFAAKAKAATARAESMKEYLLHCLQTAELPEVRGARFRIVRRKNPVAVDLFVDAEALPERFRKERVIYSADKRAIKDAIEAGEVVVGALLVQRERIEVE